MRLAVVVPSWIPRAFCWSLASCVAATAVAAPTWRRVDLFGGSITTVAQSPVAPATLYAAVDESDSSQILDGAVYHSADGGGHWRRQSGPLAPGVQLLDLVVDAADQQTVYRLRSDGLIERSSDSGANWTSASPAIPVGALVAGNSAGSLVAGTSSGLLRSDDQGRTWRLVVAFGAKFVRAIGIDPREPNRWIALVSQNDRKDVLERSLDGGLSWSGTTVASVTYSWDTARARVVFDPTRAGVAYAFFVTNYFRANDLYRTADGGLTWSQLQHPLPLNDLAVSGDGVLLAATSFGLARSTDEGGTWTPPLEAVWPHSPPNDDVHRLVVPSAPSHAVYAAGASGVWRSDDGAEHWSFVNRGIFSQPVWAVSFAPATLPRGLAVAGPSLQSTSDSGETWRPVHQEAQGPHPDRLGAMDPRFPRSSYGLDFDGFVADSLLRTRDGGRTWSVPGRFPFSCSCCDCGLDLTLALDPRRPGRVYVGGLYSERGSGSFPFLLRSDDSFATFKSLAPLPNPVALIVRPEALFALACDGLRRSRDGGVSWRVIGALPIEGCVDRQEAASLVIDPDDPQRLLVGTHGAGLFTSTDGGVTFVPMGTNLRQAQISTLLVGTGAGKPVVAGVAGRGVFVWDPIGDVWVARNEGLPVSMFLGGLTFDPQHPSVLFAGTRRGLFRIDLADEDRTARGETVTVPFPGIVQVDAHDPRRLYAPTPYGLMRLSLEPAPR